ncbi:hypothetical protein ASE95_13835 [Sphingomonas sp. Leaf231]|uniref:hypothetical protein n=1 Tax=Sphingomonas sp. Leaf231 TaxID=1736301 RepID=UPI0007012C68|nr:hypothetical protein [Sphingomonas sp. Leaf231]KQN90544.1 hypothetical protein ASE95_13835 [Sphingomonas sp. Leaf231]
MVDVAGGACHRGEMPSAVAAVAVTILAFVAGLTMPDVDLHLWLGHRSAVTHSVAPACVLLSWRRWYPAACGMAGGIGLHLAADSFPNRMIGYATVKLPFAGALSAGASYAWLAINAVAALALAAWLARRLHAPMVAMLLALAATVAGARYLWRTDGGWPVLAIVAAGAWLMWRRRRVG